MEDGAGARSGAIAMLPFAVGLAPFAFVIGATAAEQGSPLAGWSGSWLVYGGSAHLAALRAMHTGVGIAVATGLLINARLLVYSASLGRRWRDEPVWFRLVAAAFIVDPTWAVAERRGDGGSPSSRRRFFLGAGIALGVCWSATIAAGAVIGGRFGGADLEVAVPLCLIALLGPSLARPDGRLPVLVAAAVAVIAIEWPGGTGFLAAIVAGCAAGAVVERRSPSSDESELAESADSAESAESGQSMETVSTADCEDADCWEVAR